MVTTTPCFFTSSASAFVQVCRPPLVHEYVARREEGIRPERDPTLRMRDLGLPRPEDRAIKEGRIARVI